MATHGTTVRMPESVVYREFDSETVVLNLASGSYHGLNRTGGRMLEALARTSCMDDAAAVVASEFGMPLEQVRRDMQRFCDGLLERGLVELVPAEARSSSISHP